MSAPQLRAIRADIATLLVDATVNAANSSLPGGGGVDGANHRAAGSQLAERCGTLRDCRPAKFMSGHRLPANNVIHTVGPVRRGGGEGEPELRAACHRRWLEVAARHGLLTAPGRRRI